jgi:hypothetical protein
MKNKRRVFLFLMLFILVNAFGQQNSGNNDGVQGSLVPLTFDIVKLIESKDLFNRLDYYLSSDLALTTVPEKNVNASNGGLVIDNGNIVQTTKILKTNKGEYYKYDPKTNQENFIIRFQGFDHILQFIRNAQTNRFDFYGMDVGCTFAGPRPYLCIFVDQIGEVKGQGGQTPPPEQSPVLIMGNGRLGKDVIVSYIVNKGSAMNQQQIDTLVSLYIREAQTEGINHDIAIAQMCYATRFLNNRQLLDTRNYGGLNADSGISVKYGSRHGNMEEGVRAHIQHVKGYASTIRPKNEIVDRRYDLLIANGICGTVKTLDELFTVWLPLNARNYSNEIRKILGELYQ